MSAQASLDIDQLKSWIGRSESTDDIITPVPVGPLFDTAPFAVAGTPESATGGATLRAEDTEGFSRCKPRRASSLLES
jgi:hypothetical protein